MEFDKKKISKALTERVIGSISTERPDIGSGPLRNAEQQVKVYMEEMASVKAAVEQESQAYAQLISLYQEQADASEKMLEMLAVSEKTGTCDCCLNTEVPQDSLNKINSGQQLCPDCLEDFLNALSRN